MNKNKPIDQIEYEIMFLRATTPSQTTTKHIIEL